MSNIYKSSQTRIDTTRKVIQPKPLFEYPTTSNVHEDVVSEKKTETEEQQKERMRLLEKQMYENIEQAKQQWIQERELYVREAYKEGYENGFKEGYQDVQHEYAHLLQQANEVMENTIRQYDKHLHSQDRYLLKLALQIAERIVNQTLQEEENFIPIVKEALSEVREHSNIVIRIHPSRYNLLLPHIDEWRIYFPPETLFSIFVDETLELTSLWLETPYGKVDASIETQLELLKKSLEEKIKGENE